MTLYAGQTEHSVTPLEKERGLTLFDEATRKQANNALKTGVVSYELKSKLETMYVDGSYQAGYYLGTMIIQGFIEYPIVASRNIPRGDAGPGMEGEEYERMVKNMSLRMLEESDGHKTGDQNVACIDNLNHNT